MSAAGPPTPPAAGRHEAPPVVSVGLAVYNGEPYLESAITSILEQTFTDLELIICDNASTDGTEQICRAFAHTDARVRYYRNETNIGGANNENLTFGFARGRFFRWAADDDLLAPTLIERCVDVLELEPDVVVCHTEVIKIDADGREIGRVVRNRPPGRRPHQLFAELTKIDVGCEETYGLIRTSALAETGLQRNYTDSDRTLLAHLALLGRYVEIPEPLFYKRVHSGNSMQTFPDWRERMAWFGDEYETRITLPHWSQLFHYLSLIATAPVSIGTKLRCYAFMPVWVMTFRRWRSLGKDVGLAGIRLTRLARRRPQSSLG
jgi:glycosyltransferase involved in cell wall biosynthesis